MKLINYALVIFISHEDIMYSSSFAVNGEHTSIRIKNTLSGNIVWSNCTNCPANKSTKTIEGELVLAALMQNEEKLVEFKKMLVK